MLRTCTCCKITKDSSNFYRNLSRKDKLHTECSSCMREYNNKNRKRISEYEKNYRAKNKKKINKKLVNKRKINSEFKLVGNLRHRVNLALKNNQKSGHTLTLLGCTILELKNHLEKQFQPGMNWSNYTLKGWHIDHICPCASFDLSKPEEQLKCFHYSNLQPLWWIDNLNKKDKFNVTK